MKKRTIRLAALACTAAMVLSASGCTSSLNDAEIKEAYQTALDNSIQADLYFWKETVFNGTNSTYRQVNAYAEQGKDYEILLDEQGNYATRKVHVLERTNSKNTLEIFCGPSLGENGGAEQEMLLERTMGESKWNAFTQKQMRAADYFNSQAFQQAYGLGTLLAELKELTADDMDFTIKGAKQEKKGNTTTLVFAVKEAYFQRYEAANSSPSLFTGTSKVSIEISYDRIAHVITYVTENLGGMTNETEKYKLEIVYLGPKIDIPNYQ